MTRRTLVIASLALAAVGLAWVAVGGADVDRSIPARPGETLAAEVVLGSGFSFDKGSLEISSHASDDVRVVVDTTGWGEYAVDVEVRESPAGVRLLVRVDGFLYWMFGGPTVDIRVWVPQDYSVDAKIAGGPLLLEDLRGAITARVDDSELSVRRVEGAIRLVSGDGEIRAEDAEGVLTVESGDGPISVSGTRGDVRVRSHAGDVRVASVTGSVDVSVERTSIEIERVRGNVRASSERGGIDVTDVEGAVDAETDRGRIQIADLEGPVLARSRRGGIEVEFLADPAGAIFSKRGSITIEVPRDAGFDLDAQTARGEVELDSDLAFMLASDELHGLVHLDDPGRAYAALGRDIAAHATAQVHAHLERGFRTGQWDWAWDWDWSHAEAETDSGASDDPNGSERSRVDGFSDEDAHAGAGRWGGWDDWRGGRQDADWERGGRRAGALAGAVNGGGNRLEIRTARGSIHIDER